MTLQDLYEEHRELFRIGEKLIEIASFDPPHMQELVAARHQMAQAVARHLGNEARLALMPLSASTDPYDRALARRGREGRQVVDREPARRIPRHLTTAKAGLVVDRRVSLMEPVLEELLSQVDAKFTLVTVSARRAREINSYFNQLGDGLGAIVPPQVTSVSRKPLSIALEEIQAEKITYERIVVADEDELEGEPTDAS